ncbi:MAG: hypothetical protein WD273_13985 [Trueperaceae bacterium]
MKRILSIIVTALFLTTASAVELPDNAQVTLVSESGIVRGFGTIVEGDLSLTLEMGAEGFVTLIIEAANGTVVTVDGLVSSSGRVILTGDAGFEDLAETVVAAGGEVQVTFEDRIAADVESLPQEAQDGIAGAASNYAEAQEKAAEGQVQAEASASAGENAEGNANADVNIDVEVGAGSDNQR